MKPHVRQSLVFEYCSGSNGLLLQVPGFTSQNDSNSLNENDFVSDISYTQRYVLRKHPNPLFI